MCGICGILDFGGAIPPEKDIQVMLRQIERRGPDDQGVHIEPGLGFGHRRLSIIDLSHTGRQPMEDPELGLCVTYNGEIYNYNELRDELKKVGYEFFSTSDTEVLLKGYHCWGESVVEKLNGMFAFCLYDRGQRNFIFGRDRLGIKPLYYVQKDNQLYFASNIQSLHAGGATEGELSPEALYYYLTFHAVVPAPHTVFRDVQKLEPGSLMIINSSGKKTIKRFWDVEFSRKKKRSEEEWIASVLDSLDKSVERRMVSDVPVGALLSGGVDSSLIVALMAEKTPNIKTFSIGFENVGTEEGNEFRYSDIIAERFGTDHKKIFVSSSHLLESLKGCVREMAEPMVSHDVVAFYLLAEQVSKDVKVVLSGQGADEIFGGYHWYPKIMAANGNAIDVYAENFFDRDHKEICQTLETTYWPQREHAKEFVSQEFDKNQGGSPIDKALRLDTTVMLIDDPVKRLDNMTMAWGLEARVPFLDHEVVELAASIPASLKVRNGGKHILKKAAERKIPSEVIYRKKGYFPVPALKYIRDEYLDFSCDILNSKRTRERGLFQEKYINKLLESPERHMTVLKGSKLWQLTLLEYWLHEMGV